MSPRAKEWFARNSWPIIVTVCGVVFTAFAAWVTQGNKVSAQEKKIFEVDIRLDSHIKESDKKVLEIYGFVQRQDEINSSVNRSLDKIDTKLDRLLRR